MNRQVNLWLILKTFVNTDYRGIVQILFDKKRYGQRWQVETVYSMIKRYLTDCISSKSYWAQYRKMLLLAITNNFLIVLLVNELFYEAKYLIRQLHKQQTFVILLH